MQTVVETLFFVCRAEKLSTEDEYDHLIVYLAHILWPDEIVGTGGVRKVRFEARGKRKSGGVRVIYHFYDRDMPIYALRAVGSHQRRFEGRDWHRRVLILGAVTDKPMHDPR